MWIIVLGRRFAGLAGIVGLNEIKELRHGDDLSDVARRTPCVGAVGRAPGLALVAPTVLQANPCLVHIGDYSIGPHGQMPSPRNGKESHHGVMSAWMRAAFGDAYKANDAPAVLMSEAEHNATRSVYNSWRAQIVREQGSFSWNNVSESQVRELSETMFEQAGTPAAVRQE